MRKRLYTLFLIILVLLPAAGRAQDGYIRVTGMVYNSEEKDDYGKPKVYDNIMVYIFDTVAEGRKAASMLSRKIRESKDSDVPFFFDPHEVAADVTEKSLEGTSWPYSLSSVYSEGSLIFMDILGEHTYALVEVRGRTQIDVTLRIKGVTHTLDAATLTAKKGARVTIVPPLDYGDTIFLRKSYVFPKDGLPRADSRFALQTFLMTNEYSSDTLEFRTALVRDGKDYHRTQLRRMGYNPGRDILYAMADTAEFLSDTTTHVSWSDKIVKDSGSRGVIMAKLWFEDYNTVYFRDSMEVEDLSRVARPMQFLQFDISETTIDPDDPICRRNESVRSVEGDMQLPIEFEVGKATIDRESEQSLFLLDSLKRIVHELTYTPGSTLKTYRISGTASPEGNLAFNEKLARERMAFIDREVRSVINPRAYDHMQRPRTESRVASWAEFADTLASGGDSTLRAIASEIRSLTPAKIASRPYYESVVKPNLHRLRLVTFTYRQTIQRVLTTEEILSMYRENPSADFTPHEYWVIMKNLKDKAQLENVCRRAIDQDARYQSDPLRRWILPSNILAGLYLSRGQADTTILAPFIDESEVLNRPIRYGENTFIVNHSAVVANQVSMMILGEHYSRAAQLSQYFANSQDPALRKLYAIAMCKAGYFRYGTPESMTYYEFIHDSSPRNAVVMDMAMPEFLPAVRDELELLDPDDPVSWYLRAQFECVEYFSQTNETSLTLASPDVRNRAVLALAKAFSMEPSLERTASGDWYIFKDLLRDALSEWKSPGSVVFQDEQLLY